MFASEGCLRNMISICNQCCAEGFASADATRGQWKQTNVCGRPLDPFAVASHVTWFLSLQGKTKRTQTKNFTQKVKYGSVQPEGFQRAIGKPFGRLRRGEIPAYESKNYFLKAAPFFKQVFSKKRAEYSIARCACLSGALLKIALLSSAVMT